MNCEQAQVQWLGAVYDGQDASATAVQAHIGTCAACRQFVARHQALNTVLAQDTDTEPRPGFDTRFFAQLKSLQQSSVPRRLPMWAWSLAGAVACLVAGIVWWHRPVLPTAPPGELAMAMELNMYRENVDMLVNLQDVEAFALLERLPPDALPSGDKP